MTVDLSDRYHRQMLIDGFGPDGQARLGNSAVLVAGAGGLGTPNALYLAAAGIGRLTLVDCDTIEPSNLNRQILHWESDVGRAKTESAASKLSQVNAQVSIDARPVRIDSHNVSDLVAGHDVVVDAMDNFGTRRLLNRACVEQGIPFVYGGVQGLGGMITTLKPPLTGCLDCLFPDAPPPSIFPVLGTTPGTIATLQATEVIKLITGIGDPLLDRLLIYDGRAMRFDTIRIGADPDCLVCGSAH